MADEVARDAAEQEELEEFLLQRIEDGAALPGTYPPNEATKDRVRGSGESHSVADTATSPREETTRKQAASGYSRPLRSCFGVEPVEELLGMDFVTAAACVSRAGCTISSMPKRFPAPASLPERFWQGFATLVHDLAPRNRALLGKRDAMQRPDRCMAPRAARQARSSGRLRRFAPASYAVWETGELAVKPADNAVQRWSTDPRSRVPALPGLGADDPLPRCRQTVHRGAVIHG